MPRRAIFAFIAVLGAGLVAACASTPAVATGEEPLEDVCRPTVRASSEAMPQTLGAVVLSSGHLSDALGNGDGATTGWERQAEAHLEAFEAGHRCWLGLDPDDGELSDEMAVADIAAVVCDIDCGVDGPVFTRGGCPWAVAVWRTTRGWQAGTAAIDLRKDGARARQAFTLTGRPAPIGPLPTLNSVATSLTTRFGAHCQAPLAQSLQRWTDDIARGTCPLQRVASHDAVLDEPTDGTPCRVALALLDLEATRRCRPASDSARVLADYFLGLYSGFVWDGSLEWTSELHVEGWRTQHDGSPDAVAALEVAARLKPPLAYEHHLHEQLATAWAELPFDLGRDALDGLFHTSEAWDAESLGPAAFVARARSHARGEPVPQLHGVARLTPDEWDTLERQLSPKCAPYAIEWRLTTD